MVLQEEKEDLQRQLTQKRVSQIAGSLRKDDKPEEVGREVIKTDKEALILLQDSQGNVYVGLPEGILKIYDSAYQPIGEPVKLEGEIQQSSYVFGETAYIVSNERTVTIIKNGRISNPLY